MNTYMYLLWRISITPSGIHYTQILHILNYNLSMLININCFYDQYLPDDFESIFTDFINFHIKLINS